MGVVSTPTQILAVGVSKVNFRRKKKLSIAKQEEIIGYIFVTPYILGFSLFYIIPFILAFIISFTDLHFASSITKARFIGLENFAAMLKDQMTIDSFGRSMFYTILYVPLIMVTSLLIACVINQKIFARNLVRTMVFLPYVSNLVAISIIWALLLDYKDGPINMFLSAMGIVKPPLWLVGNTYTVIPTIVMIVCWQGIGFHVITFLAALQGVPRELLESSTIDGANGIQKFLNITLPTISPTTFFLLITSILTSFQNFGIVKVLTKGGPGNSSWVLSINIVEEAFGYNKIAYATSQALVLFLIIITLTVILWNSQKRWVHYV